MNQASFFEYFCLMKPSEEYILKQPKQYQEIILFLCETVNRIVPESELLFKWGIPYIYLKKKPFIYLAPNHKKGFVDVGFAKGFQLKGHLDVLVGENRNTVKSLRYFSLSEIDSTILEELVMEASALYK